MFTSNIGSTEGNVRIVLGLILAIVTFMYVATFSTTVTAILAISAVGLLATGAVRWCPSRMFGGSK